jgi:hypothetical protein
MSSYASIVHTVRSEDADAIKKCIEFKDADEMHAFVSSYGSYHRRRAAARAAAAEKDRVRRGVFDAFVEAHGDCIQDIFQVLVQDLPAYGMLDKGANMSDFLDMIFDRITPGQGVWFAKAPAPEVVVDGPDAPPASA